MPSMKDIIKESFRKHLMLSLAKSPERASNLDRYHALALSIRDLMVERWIASKDTYEVKQPRTVYYISLEFLMGRTLGNAMINLGVYDAAVEALKELGLKIELLRDEEVDAGLGNGGLGRLAACFLDSMATMELPAGGYGIRYDYGIFRQIIQTTGSAAAIRGRSAVRSFPVPFSSVAEWSRIRMRAINTAAAGSIRRRSLRCPMIRRSPVTARIP